MFAGITMVREDSMNLNGLGRFVNREMRGVWEAVQQCETDIVVADSARERILFN
jgi:hypothetical protein